MPLLEINTNTKIENLQKIAEKASMLTANLLEKPESYIMIKINPDQNLVFAGNNKPAAHVKLKSLGLVEANTADFSKKICTFIHAELNIDSARIYIEFSSPERHMWGWDGKTF